AFLLEPPELARDGEGRGGRRDGARAPAHLELRDLGAGRPGERGRAEQERDGRGQGDDAARAGPHHAVTSFFRARGSRASEAESGASSAGCSEAAFSDASQNSTRRRTSWMARLSPRPTNESTSSTENCPETSIVKF